MKHNVIISEMFTSIEEIFRKNHCSPLITQKSGDLSLKIVQKTKKLKTTKIIRIFKIFKNMYFKTAFNKERVIYETFPQLFSHIEASDLSFSKWFLKVTYL